MLSEKQGCKMDGCTKRGGSKRYFVIVNGAGDIGVGRRHDNSSFFHLTININMKKNNNNK